jgi:hypothetical protein
MSARAIGKGIVCASLAAALIWLEPLEGQSTAPAVPKSDLDLRAKAYGIIGQPGLALRDFREAVRLMSKRHGSQR